MHILRTEYAPRSEGFSIKALLVVGGAIAFGIMILTSGCAKSNAADDFKSRGTTSRDPNPTRTWTVDRQTGLPLLPSDGHYGWEENDQ